MRALRSWILTAAGLLGILIGWSALVLGVVLLLELGGHALGIR